MAPAYSSAAFLTFFSLVIGVVGETCYYPDGSTDAGHFACSSGGTSVCCAENFECLSNGLCNDYRYENYERVLRGGCTDKNWGAGCPQTCTSIWPQGDEVVYVCSKGKYCCGRSKDCCNGSGAEFFDFGTPQVIATAGKTVASATSVPNAENEPQSTSNARQQAQASSKPTQDQQQNDAPSATEASSTGASDEPEATDRPTNTETGISGDSTAKAEATLGSSSSGTASLVSDSGSNPAVTNTINNYNTTSSNNNKNNNNNRTVAIAAGVGVGVGVLVLGLLVASCWYIRRKRQQPGLRSRNMIEIGESSTPAVEVAESNSGAGLGGNGRAGNMVFELDGGTRGVELPVGDEAKEMHGESAENKKWPGTFK